MTFIHRVLRIIFYHWTININYAIFLHTYNAHIQHLTPESHYFISVYKFNVFETLLKIRTAASRLKYYTFMGAIIKRRHGIRNDRFVRAKFVRVDICYSDVIYYNLQFDQNQKKKEERTTMENVFLKLFFDFKFTRFVLFSKFQHCRDWFFLHFSDGYALCRCLKKKKITTERLVCRQYTTTVVESSYKVSLEFIINCVNYFEWSLPSRTQTAAIAVGRQNGHTARVEGRGVCAAAPPRFEPLFLTNSCLRWTAVIII